MTVYNGSTFRVGPLLVEHQEHERNHRQKQKDSDQHQSPRLTELLHPSHLACFRVCHAIRNACQQIRTA